MKYKVRNSKKNKRTQEVQLHVCVYTYDFHRGDKTQAIKIFQRHLGPNLLIFAVKVSPTFYGDFMTFHREKTPTMVISC